MIIDGRALARDILARTSMRAARLPHTPRVVAYIAGAPTPATESYLKIKAKSAAEAGCEFVTTDRSDFFHEADAAIVQLPTIPEAMILLSEIPIEKDADVLSKASREKFERGDFDALLPPVVAALRHILEAGAVIIAGKKAVVIGDGFLVGKPATIWLRHELAHVTTVTDSFNLGEYLADADIIVSGAGVPHFITPDLLKEGAVLIDAGTSESNGEVAGDADPSCADKCSLFTPVPGGVGPVAVACLFENAVTLAERTSIAKPLT
jgi:methylenetetrahydrofolate dehydrogenase (NADP+)/methenyltetrahydrofolate cyclohydrolase